MGCDKGVIHVEFTKEFSGNKLRLQQVDTAKKISGVFSEILGKRVQVIYSVHKETEDVDVESHLRGLMGDALEVFDE